MHLNATCESVRLAELRASFFALSEDSTSAQHFEEASIRESAASAPGTETAPVAAEKCSRD